MTTEESRKQVAEASAYLARAGVESAERGRFGEVRITFARGSVIVRTEADCRHWADKGNPFYRAVMEAL